MAGALAREKTPALLAAFAREGARRIGASLSEYLRAPATAQVVSCDAGPFEEMAGGETESGIAGVFALPHSGGSFLIEVEPSLGFAMIDRLLGGPGAPSAEAHGLTDLERPVMRRLLERMAASLPAEWGIPGDPLPELFLFDPGARRKELVPPRDTVVAVRLEIRLNDVHGGAALYFPSKLLEDAAGRAAPRGLEGAGRELTPPAAGSTAAPDPTGDRRGQEAGLGRNSALLAAVLEATAPVRVVLGEATIALRDLLDLKAGDCVLLETTRESLLPLKIGDGTGFFARVGRSGPQLAVELVRAGAGEEDERENARRDPLAG